MESCVPPGFRFHPTDEELVGYYLKKKVASQKIDLDVIKDIDLYRIEPWDLTERCRIGYEEQNEWYFFSHKDKKYPTGTRTNRATIAGFWKATGRDKAVSNKTQLIGMRKTLVFYKGRAPNGQKSDWIMHEYRLESDENGPPQEEGWVVCRAFKKKATAQSNNINKAIEGWDSSNYFYEGEPSGGIMSPVMDTSDRRHHYLPRSLILPRFIPSSSSSHSLFCKQEFEHQTHNSTNMNNLKILMQQSDHPFLQLPQLESPSLPMFKRPITSISLLSDQTNSNNNNDLEDIDQQMNNKGQSSSMEKVTDWRALDKFVASQLSQDNTNNEQALEIGASFGDVDHHNHYQGGMNNGSADMALLMLQGSTSVGRDEEEGEGSEDKFISGFLASTSESDLGVCIFDK